MFGPVFEDLPTVGWLFVFRFLGHYWSLPVVSCHIAHASGGSGIPVILATLVIPVYKSRGEGGARDILSSGPFCTLLYFIFLYFELEKQDFSSAPTVA